MTKNRSTESSGECWISSDSQEYQDAILRFYNQLDIASGHMKKLVKRKRLDARFGIDAKLIDDVRGSVEAIFVIPVETNKLKDACDLVLYEDQQWDSLQEMYTFLMIHSRSTELSEPIKQTLKEVFGILNINLDELLKWKVISKEVEEQEEQAA